MQVFDYFVIFDLQATCLKDAPIRPQEIIELTCTWLNTKTWESDPPYHTFMSPVYKPKLSPFCIHLTGIRQKDVDQAPVFSQVILCTKEGPKH